MKFAKILFAAGFALAFALPSIHAQSPKSGHPLETIRHPKQVESLGPGSELVIVCKASDSAVLVKIKDAKEAKKLCREGRMITCHDCRAKYRVLWRNPTGKSGGPDQVMEIVNSKGEPCMFMARLK